MKEVGVPATTATAPNACVRGVIVNVGVVPVPLKLALTIPPGVAETSSVAVAATALIG